MVLVVPFKIKVFSDAVVTFCITRQKKNSTKNDFIAG